MRMQCRSKAAAMLTTTIYQKMLRKLSILSMLMGVST